MFVTIYVSKSCFLWSETLGESFFDISTNQDAIDAVITPIRDTPIVIINRERNLPWVVVGYVSPYATVKVVKAHHKPSPISLILEPGTSLSITVIWIAEMYAIKKVEINTLFYTRWRLQNFFLSLLLNRVCPSQPFLSPLAQKIL